MKKNVLIPFFAAITLAACAPLGEAGDACTTVDDCAEGLECHIEDHSDHDHEGEEHVEEGVCEEADAHDDDHGDDHDDE